MALSPEQPDGPRWTLGDRLIKARKHAGLSQAEMADYLGVSRAAISAWENDENEPRASVLRRWALRCEVTLDWLIDINDEGDWPPGDPTPTPPPRPRRSRKPSSGWFTADELRRSLLVAA